MMNNPYKTREGGATVTIFVPYDCNNNRPFCINKGEYADLTGFSLEKICESIRRMDAITPYCDFVFTGGEPFADIKKLQTMIDLIPTTHRVFINTTLPVFESQSEEDILAFAERNKYAMEIDFELQPPMFEVSPTHYAATWLLHPQAPKVEMPKIITERIRRMKERGGNHGA